MWLGERLEIRSGGRRWVIARADALQSDRDAARSGRSLPSADIDEWCDNAMTWPDMLELYQEIAGPTWHPPTAADVNEWIKPRLRRAFEDGTLIAMPGNTPLDPTTKSEEGTHAQPTKIEPPLPPPAPRRPVAPPKALFSFAIRFVDEIGTAISGVDLTFLHGGAKDEKSTDGNGVARLEDSPVRTATAKIADAKALRKALKPKWDQVRGDRKWLDESQGVTVVRLESELPSFNLAADKLRVVSIQPSVRRVRLLGGFFDTAKSFPFPAVLEGLRSVVQDCVGHTAPTLLIVGHTDSAGTAGYNDKLSLERADAIKDYLTDNVDGWLKSYADGVPAEKRWGSAEDSMMIFALPDAAARTPDQDAIRWYQETRGLSVDGIAGPKTRRALITEYMALDGTSLPKAVEVVTHGCGENFPDVPAPDSTDTPQNRRVECFLFDRDLGVQPPPPGKNSAKGAPEYPEWCRRAKETRDHAHEFARIRVQPRLGNAFRYSLRVADMGYEGSGDEDDIIDHYVPAQAGSGALVVHLPATGDTYQWTLQIGTLDAPDDVTGMQQRLTNLGYYSGSVSGTIDEETEGALRLFQEDFALKPTGQYDAPTRDKLRTVHDEPSA
jgi:outer membrane protein OmpA-like peptidoglycan-associated protein